MRSVSVSAAVDAAAEVSIAGIADIAAACIAADSVNTVAK